MREAGDRQTPTLPILRQIQERPGPGTSGQEQGGARCNSGGHLRVLPVIVTARPKDAVGQFDVDAARSQGVLIITKENLMDAIERSVVSQDPDKLFALGWESLHREANSKPSRIE